MSNVDIIEAAKGGPFRFRHEGRTYLMPDPAEMTFMAVLSCLQVEHIPHPPRMPEWKRALLFQRWSAHYDLPPFNDAQRLVYLTDRYRSALVYDLRDHDFGALWRARRWRTLLDLIDHLPQHSWYSSAVASDEEHAKMLAESIAARKSEGEQGPTGPPLHTWTPEVAVMTEVLDAVRQVAYTIVAVNNTDKNKAPKPPSPAPRPVNPFEAAMKRATFEARKEQHDALTKRLLPHKR